MTATAFNPFASRPKPKPVGKPNRFTAHGSTWAQERQEALRIRRKEIAELETMWAARPLVPPPLPKNLPEVMSAGRLALQRDRKTGAYQDGFSFETRAGRRAERGRL